MADQALDIVKKLASIDPARCEVTASGSHFACVLCGGTNYAGPAVAPGRKPGIQHEADCPWVAAVAIAASTATAPSSPDADSGGEHNSTGASASTPADTVEHVVRVGMKQKWAPMLGYEVPDTNSGVDLLLFRGGQVVWRDPKANATDAP